MKLRTFLASLAAVTISVMVCVRYLDIPLARAVQQLTRTRPVWSRWTEDIPDLLLVAVCVITAASGIVYFYRLYRQRFNRFTWLCLHLACVAPVSYLFKSGSKFLFGRVNTRYWLTHPEAYRFNWFHGTGTTCGFPSGHMVVYAALAAAICRCYPRHSLFPVLGAFVLGGALIATNYHFLGDVIAGAYLGICVELFTFRILDRPRSKVQEKAES
jgi:membrane-associated phospholipid phosphatase